MKVSRLIDYIIIFTLISFVSFVWTRSIVHNTILLVVLSLILSTLISSIIFFFLNKKHKKKECKKYKKEQIEILRIKLLTNNTKENLLYFANILKEKFTILPRNNYLVMNDKTLIFVLFDSLKINQNDIIKLYSNYKHFVQTHFVILCNAFDSSESKSIFDKKYLIEILELEDIVKNVLDRFNIELPKVKTNKNKRIDYKNLKNSIFERKKSKKYAFLGVFFFISSIFFRYNYFFIIFTTINFLFALISFTNSKGLETKKTTTFEVVEKHN